MRCRIVRPLPKQDISSGKATSAEKQGARIRSGWGQVALWQLVFANVRIKEEKINGLR